MNGIVEARRKAGMTQQNLADALNVDRSTVAKWETGAAFPTGKKIPFVAQALKCEVSEIFSKEDMESSKKAGDKETEGGEEDVRGIPGEGEGEAEHERGHAGGDAHSDGGRV